MKKIATGLLALVVVVSMILAGCVTSTPTAPNEPTTPITPTQPTTPTEPTTPTTPTEPVTTIGFEKPTGPPSYNPYEGLGIKPDGKPYRFAFVPVFLYHEWVASGTGFLRSAVERSGATLDVFDCHIDAAIELQTLQDIQAGDYDGVISLPVDSAGAGASIDNLWDAGIPTVSWDYKPMSDNLVCHAEEDQYILGQIGGQWFVDYAAETGQPLKIYEIWGILSSDGCIRRHEGFRSVVDSAPNITVVEGPGTNFQMEATMSCVLDAFSSDPDLNALWAMGGAIEGYSQGLIFADRYYQIGDPRHVVTFNNIEDAGAMKALRDGLIDQIATMSCWVETDLALKALLTYVCLGEDVPSEQMVTPRLIGPDDTEQDYLYGNMQGVPFEWWPIIPDEHYENIGFTDYIPTPTK